MLALVAAAPLHAEDARGKPDGDPDAGLRELLADPAFLVRSDSQEIRRGGARNAVYLRDAAATSRTAEILDELQAIDPYESVNRYAYEINAFLRRYLLDPVALTYLQYTNRPVQHGVSSVFANLREPMTIINNLLLGDVAQAGNATYRFGINTTIGIGGYYDVAADLGVPRHLRTLEEVLCRYGIPAGPYVVLPVIGPGTVRDAVGRVTTLLILYTVLGPIYIPYRITDIAVQYVDLREQLRFIDSISIDPYTGQKSAHLQISKLRCRERTEAQIQLFGQ
ncbi:MAG: VacJ family lipoprotein [Proteobacteria bacterium]|nr:VacJ family lipoprotein [Pseudomonadota bacterium]